MKTRSGSVRTLAILIAAIGVAAVAAPPARAEELRCPAAVKRSIAGWTKATAVRPAAMTYATLFDGAFGDDSSAQAPAETRQGRTLVQTWDLKPYWSGGSGVWVRCHYRGTRTTLARALPRTLTRCTQTHLLDSKDASRRMSGIACR